MKNKLVVLLAFLIMVPGLSLFALIEIGADYALSLNTKWESKSGGSEIDDKSLSGFGFYGVFSGLGVGYDQFEAKYEVSNSGTTNDIGTTKYTLYNVFYRVSLPVIHIDLGILTGPADFTESNGQNADSSSKNASGFILRGGFKFAPLIAGNLSYRSFKNASFYDGFNDVESTLIAIGLSFGI